MEKFTTLSGVAAPLPIINLDTDKIFPAIFLKTIKRTGLSQWLFQEIRFRADGSENPFNTIPKHSAELDNEPYWFLAWTRSTTLLLPIKVIV